MGLVFWSGRPEVEAIYDATTDTLTPFSNGRIVDLNANGQILLEHEFNYYLQSGGFITAVSDLFPSGSGWSPDFAIQMNDSGAIVGWGELHTNAGSSAGHGFLLSPPPLRIPRGKRDDIIAIILWGVIKLPALAAGFAAMAITGFKMDELKKAAEEEVASKEQ